MVIHHVTHHVGIVVVPNWLMFQLIRCRELVVNKRYVALYELISYFSVDNSGKIYVEKLSKIFQT